MSDPAPYPLDDLTLFQADILRVLAREGALKGLDIKAEIESAYGTEIRHGRLYPNLDELAHRELIRKGTFDRRTNRYELAGDGVDLVSWLAADWNRALTELQIDPSLAKIAEGTR